MLPDQTGFLNLFVAPPGDLLYFLAVFAIGQVSLFMALGQRLRCPSERAPKVYTTASAVLVAAWALLMVGALLALASGLPARALLPPLERLAQAVTVIVVGWAFINAESDRWASVANMGALGLIALVMVGYVFTGLNWLEAYSRTGFNQTVAGAAWMFSIAAFVAFGMVLMLVRVREIVDAPLKLVFFALLLLGFGLSLVQMANGALDGDAAGASRLAFVTASLILPTIIYRAIVSRLEDEIVFAQAAPQPRPLPVVMALPSMLTSTPITTERESAQLMKALGLMLEGAAPENIPQRVLMAAITSLKADIGAILTVHDAHYSDLLLGMDRVMEREIAALSINLDDQPTLLNAIERRQQRVLYPDRNAEELSDLYARLDTEGNGPVYLQPLTRGKELVGVLLIGMPYARRELSDSEQELLKGIGIIGASLLALSNASRDARIEAESRIIQAVIQGMPPAEVGDDTALHMWEQMREELERSRGQSADLNQEIQSLRAELDNERSRVALALDDTSEGKAISQRIIALNDDVLRTMEERDRLSAQLRNAEAALASTATDSNTSLYSTLIDALQRETSDLTLQRDLLQTQIQALKQDKADPLAVTDDEAEPNAAATALIERLNDEKLRTERERDQYAERLAEIEVQFTALGIEGGAAGMAQIVSQLYEQRAGLQARFDALKAERDTLSAERSSLQEVALKEREREGRLQILQAEVTHLASDREAVGKQRERFRSERDDLNSKLNALRDQQGRLLAELAGYAQELTEEQAEHGQLRTTIEQLSNERSNLIRERDQLLARQQALGVERDGLLARVDGDRERLEQLGHEGIGSLTLIITNLTEQRAALEHELHQSRTTLATLEDQIDLMQIRGGGAPGPIVYRPDNPELFVNMVEELRTPMTSVSGYVDLVLNESAGILGEMQRKFMQRVASNLLRLQSMIDDLVQITALDAGYFRLTREAVDVIALIEDALMLASQALREKGLTVHLKLDESVPSMRVDREKITQVIGQFLTNAYLVSPPGSDLYITARLEDVAAHNGDSEQHQALHFSIEDSGGGIAPEEVGDVFARKYKAENPLIRGLGDTGVGLAIAQALIAAHEGEVWVESQVGRGSIFHFILPLQAEASPQPEAL